MDEITIHLRMRMDATTERWVITSPELQELKEEGPDLGELLSRVQHYDAPRLLRGRGLIHDFADKKLTFLTTFEAER